MYREIKVSLFVAFTQRDWTKLVGIKQGEMVGSRLYRGPWGEGDKIIKNGDRESVSKVIGIGGKKEEKKICRQYV